ncbi:MAG: hypothetical protein R3C58_04150 [Parvularculaceae bacterium]
MPAAGSRWRPSKIEEPVSTPSRPSASASSGSGGSGTAIPGTGGGANTSRKAKLQVGPWFPAPYNIEEPYINILHASQVRWTGGDLSTQQLYDQGYLDKKTGLPVKLPSGKTLTTDVYFPAGTNNALSTYWDGEWVLDWTGDADVTMLYMPKELMRRVGKNRVEFTRDAAGKRTPYHAAVMVTRLKGPLTSLRLYRKANEAAQTAGKIFNPKFTAAVTKYDVVRTMDLQAQNSSGITSIDENATMASTFWANASWKSSKRTNHPVRSAPIEAMFALAMESNTSLWFHAPITLGMPVSFYDPSVMREKDDQWAGQWRGVARARAPEIVASAEWDRYADAFVKALIESGYPADRPVYATLANEVWNFAGHYFQTTQYAWGIGEAYAPKLNTTSPTARHGYGILMARWKLAVDGALKRAGRKQNIVYVMEGQAGWTESTTIALDSAKKYLESRGEKWASHAPGFGVSVASYWAAKWEVFLPKDAWPQAIASDPKGTATRFAEFIRINPAPYGVKWAVEAAQKHQKAAAGFGVPFIGAYEGGSHLEKPSYVDAGWYKDFLWGEKGAAINRANNDAFAKAFPGVILSNYGLAGSTGGQPWFEGPYGAENPYARSWAPYLRP